MQKRALNVHIVVVHTGEKPHSCDICGKSYADPSGLSYHRKKCLTLTPEQRYHIAVQTKERPYSCEKCGNSYTQAGHLNRHKKKCIQHNIAASTSEINFDYCDETVKQEIKEESETEMIPSEFLKTEIYEQIFESSLESENDDLLKIEIKEEIQDTEDYSEKIKNELPYGVKMEDNV